MRQARLRVSVAVESGGSTGDAGTDVSSTETEPTVVTPSDGSGLEGFKWSACTGRLCSSEGPSREITTLEGRGKRGQ